MNLPMTVAIGALAALFLLPGAPAWSLPTSADDTSPLHDPIMDGEFEMDGTWEAGEGTTFVDIDGDGEREAVLAPHSAGFLGQDPRFGMQAFAADFNRIVARVEQGTIPEGAYLHFDLETGIVRPSTPPDPYIGDCELVVPRVALVGVNLLVANPADGELRARLPSCSDEDAAYAEAATEARRRAILENIQLQSVHLYLPTGDTALVLDGVRMSGARPLPLELVSEVRSTDATDTYATILEPLNAPTGGVQAVDGFYDIAAWVRHYDGTSPAPTVDLRERSGMNAVVRILTPAETGKALAAPWELAACDAGSASELVQCGVIGDARFVLDTDEVVRVRVPASAVAARGLAGEPVAIALFLDVEDGRFEATMGAAPHQPGAGWYHPAKVQLQGVPLATSLDALPAAIILAS